MGEKTAIAWTDSTWNPWRGCHKVSQGCKFCYIFREQTMYGKDPNVVVRCSPSTFNAPLKWTKPAKVFTCSWSDWFIEESDPWREEAWDIIRATPNLTYQILTKRPANMAKRHPNFTPPNVWMGITAEDQENLIRRCRFLYRSPYPIRFISVEPMLGPIDLGVAPAYVDWVICGGESGPGARPMNLDWARSLRDQCVDNYIPFFFKQIGGTKKIDGAWGGHRLDGQVWAQFPAVTR
jgi:protein gp37